MDGKRFALDVHDVTTGSLVLRSHAVWGAPALLALTPDGGTIATTVYEWSGPNGIALFDAKTGERRHLLPDTSDARALALSPDGSVLATGTGLFDPRSGKLLRRLETEGRVTGLAFTPDGKVLLVMDGGRPRAIDAGSGAPRGEPDLSGPTALSPDGLRAATLTPGGAVARWEALTGAVPVQPPEYEEMVISKNGGRVATVDRRGRVEVWETGSGRHVLSVDAPRGPLALSPDGKLLAAGLSGPAPLFFDVDRGEVLYAPRSLEGYGYAPAFSPDGRTVAVPWTDRTIRIYDLRTMALLLTGSFEGTASAVDFSRDGRKLAAAVDYGVALADVAPGADFRQLFRVQWARAVAVSPDGTRVVCGEQPPEIRDTATGELVAKLGSDDLYRPAFVFSPDGKRLLAIPEDGSVRVFDAGDGKLLMTMRGALRLGSTAFGADGKAILTACEKGAVVFWKE
jgi:WD40 repeat protein